MSSGTPLLCRPTSPRRHTGSHISQPRAQAGSSRTFSVCIGAVARDGKAAAGGQVQAGPSDRAAELRGSTCQALVFLDSALFTSVFSPESQAAGAVSTRRLAGAPQFGRTGASTSGVVWHSSVLVSWLCVPRPGAAGCSSSCALPTQWHCGIQRSLHSFLLHRSRVGLSPPGPPHSPQFLPHLRKHSVDFEVSPSWCKYQLCYLLAVTTAVTPELQFTYL